MASTVTSMTGYGSGLAEGADVTVRVELRSVNSRFCDVQVRCPHMLQDLERGVKERIQKRIGRGKINVTIDLQDERGAAQLPQLDEEMARNYIAQLQKLRVLGEVDGEVELQHVSGLPGIFKVAAESLPTDLETLVTKALDGALDAFIAMRAEEGVALTRDLRARVATMDRNLGEIRATAASSRDQLEARLRERLEVLLRPGEIDESRLAMEVVLVAERSDITEEIVRFESHNQQFLTTLESGGEVGRRLNFLLQEINREANTISSKSSDIGVTHLVVEIKEEVERLREQVQNLA
jgi:uncharacterized protein (TIGR00255 family)